MATIDLTPPSLIAASRQPRSHRVRRALRDIVATRERRGLLALLAGSWLIRLALAVQGGQFFFPDESRFLRPLETARLLWSGHPLQALASAFAATDHAGWTLVGVVPASLQVLLASLLHRPATDFAYVSAALLSGFSVASIAIVYFIARRLGAVPREALLAALMMALSVSNAYWSRHLLPYDCSMALGLLALWFALDTRSWLRASVLTGLLAGASFAVYNGYWTLALVALVTRVLPRRGRRTLSHWAGTGIAFLLVAAVPPVLASVLGSNGFGSMVAFAKSVKQGDYSDGFVLPPEYLWHAEHGLLLLWIAAAMLAVWRLGARGVQGDRFDPPFAAPLRGELARLEARLLAGIGGAAFIYLLLAVDCGVFRVFVVYGRLVRQMVPFFALATAAMLELGWRLGGRSRLAAVAVLILATGQAAFNFSGPLTQEFPREIESHLFQYGRLGHALTITGPILAGGPEGECYTLVNAQYLYPPRGVAPLEPGTVIARFRHPFEYLPYQYDGLRRFERAIVRSTDISIMLLQKPGAPADPRCRS
ncbi:MAG TPA: hypothetical protein VF761_11750 [Gemmatimonadaceae bacterium]